METYTVKIRTTGQKINHRKKQVRTPVIFNNVTGNELLFLEAQARSLRLTYEIKKELDLNKESKSDNIIKKVIVPTDEVIIEDLEPQEPNTILEKLIAENKE